MAEPVVVEVVILPGQVILGGSLSTTVTLNEQPAPAEEAEQLTVVTPGGKNAPGGGEQLIGPQSVGPDAGV
jgi:hypothetical protein